MLPHVARGIVGVGLLRKGAVVRTGTGVMVDESGLVVTANHNADRLRPGDQIVVAVPEIVPASTLPVVPMAVPALGTCAVDLNERVPEGVLPSFMRRHWVWTHAAVAVMLTHHHEEIDHMGAQGLDVAVLRLTHTVAAIRTPGDDVVPTKGPSGGDGLDSDSKEFDSEEPFDSGSVVAAAGMGREFPWELTRSLHSPFARRTRARGKPADNTGYKGTQLRMATLDPETRFFALPLANSDDIGPGMKLIGVGYSTQYEGLVSPHPMTVVPSTLDRWVFAEPEVVTTLTAALSGGPVFNLESGQLVGLMLSSTVPDTASSDTTFFQSWEPTVTEAGPSNARLLLGMQPIRPINLAAKVAQLALKKLPQLLQNQLRSTWLSVPNTGSTCIELQGVLRPLAPLVDTIQQAARGCHRSTRHWLFDEFERWCLSEFRATPSRVFRIRGPSGVGKTTVAAQLCCQSGGRVLASHFCESTTAPSLDPSNIIRSLAHRLAESLPTYATALRDSLREAYGTVPEAVTNALLALNPIELFHNLLVIPLGNVSPPSTGAVVCVIDAMDTTTPLTGNPMLQIARNEWAKLPRWMGLVITSLPSPSVHDVGDSFCITVSLDPYLANNQHDVRMFVTMSLRHKFASMEVASAAADIITRKSDGLFLYCDAVVSQLRTSPHPVLDLKRDARCLPDSVDDLFERGIAGAWRSWLNPSNPSRASDFKMVARQLFEVLVVSLEPLTYEELLEVIRLGSPHKVSAMDLRAALSCLCSQSSAMIRAAKVNASGSAATDPTTERTTDVCSKVRYCLASVSVSGWLCDGSRNAFVSISPYRGHDTVAHCCTVILSQACTSVERGEPVDTHGGLLQYALLYGMRHCRVLLRFRDIIASMCRVSFLQLRVNLGVTSVARLESEYVQTLEWSEAATSSHDNEAVVASAVRCSAALRHYLGFVLEHHKVFFKHAMASTHDPRNAAPPPSSVAPILVCALDLDPTDPVRRRTYAQLRRYRRAQPSLADLMGSSCSESESASESPSASDTDTPVSAVDSESGSEHDDPTHWQSPTSSDPDGKFGETEGPIGDSSIMMSRSIPLEDAEPDGGLESTLRASGRRFPRSPGRTGSSLNSTRELQVESPDRPSRSSRSHRDGRRKRLVEKLQSTLAASNAFTATIGRATLKVIPQDAAIAAAASAPLTSTVRCALAPEPTRIPRDASRVFHGHVGWVNGVAVSDDGRRVVSCGSDNTVRVWQPDAGTLISTLEPGRMTTQVDTETMLQHRQAGLWCITISGPGTLVAAAGETGSIFVWDVEACKLVRTLDGYGAHSGWVCGLAMDGAGTVLVSAGGDGIVRQWNLVSGVVAHQYRGHVGKVWSCALLDAGRFVVSSGADGNIRVWDGEVGGPAAVFPVGKGDAFGVSACVLRPGRVVTAGWDGRVSCWDWRSQAKVWSHGAHTSTNPDGSSEATASVRCAWFSEDGRFVFSGADNGTIVRVDATDGDDVVTLRGHTGPVTSIMTSFDGLIAFSAGRDGTVRMWNFV